MYHTCSAVVPHARPRELVRCGRHCGLGFGAGPQASRRWFRGAPVPPPAPARMLARGAVYAAAAIAVTVTTQTPVVGGIDASGITVTAPGGRLRKSEPAALSKPLWKGQPWGFYTNYPDPTDPNNTNAMLTDAMATAAGRARVEAQLAGMAKRNATLWRIFPQFQDVLAGPDTVNTSGIATLTAALEMAAAHGDCSQKRTR